MIMPKFRKKPVVIEATQWLKNGDHPMVSLGYKETGNSPITPLAPPPNIAVHPVYYLQTLEGFFEVTSGDWIIKGIKGEFYPCKPDIFESIYEPVIE